MRKRIVDLDETKNLTDDAYLMSDSDEGTKKVSAASLAEAMKKRINPPAKTSDLENDSDFVSDPKYVHTDNNYDDEAKSAVDGLNMSLDRKVDKVEGKGLSTEDYTTDEKIKLQGMEPGAQVNKLEKITVNGVEQTVNNKTVALTVMTNAVDDLINYYKKSETYTKAEVEQKISTIPKFSIKVVDELPTEDISETTVYLLKASTSDTGNLYTEYIYVEEAWEKLGTQTVDLSGYVTTEALNAALAEYSKTVERVYATYDEMIADLDNIPEGATIYVPDGDGEGIKVKASNVIVETSAEDKMLDAVLGNLDSLITPDKSSIITAINSVWDGVTFTITAGTVTDWTTFRSWIEGNFTSLPEGFHKTIISATGYSVFVMIYCRLGSVGNAWIARHYGAVEEEPHIHWYIRYATTSSWRIIASKPSLVWSNPAPTSAFTEQVLSLSLPNDVIVTEIDHFELESNATIESFAMTTTKIYLDSNASIPEIATLVQPQRYNVRGVYVYNTEPLQIFVGNNNAYGWGSSSGNTDNTTNIPYRIYAYF